MTINFQQQLETLLEELLLCTMQYDKALKHNAVLDERKKIRVRIKEIHRQIDQLKQHFSDNQSPGFSAAGLAAQTP
ncbi:MAG: hypothetical protein QM764_06990 [Chitinophagaceae bacterium]